MGRAAVLALALVLALAGGSAARSRVLFRAEDAAIGGPVEVLEVGGVRFMLAGGGVVGAEWVGADLEDRVAFPVFAVLQRAVRALSAELETAQGETPAALFLGLGAGSVPSYLHGKGVLAEIDAVDVSGQVVEAARRAFGFNSTAAGGADSMVPGSGVGGAMRVGPGPMAGTVTVADVDDFVASRAPNARRYGVVVHDLVSSANHLLCPDNLARIVDTLLAPGGALVVNFVAMPAGTHARYAAAVASGMDSLFPFVRCFPEMPPNGARDRGGAPPLGPDDVLNIVCVGAPFDIVPGLAALAAELAAPNLSPLSAPWIKQHFHAWALDLAPFEDDDLPCSHEALQEDFGDASEAIASALYTSCVSFLQATGDEGRCRST